MSGKDINRSIAIRDSNTWFSSRKIDDEFERYNNAKILVIGATSLKEKDIKGIASSLGFNKNRIECCLDYNDAKNYNYRNLQYNPNYSVVMVGAIPHSSKGKGNSSSAITEMEHKPGYPKVIRLGKNQLKITKSDIRTKFEALKVEKWI